MERVFTMELGPRGHDSKVALDGEDITDLLSGVRVSATVKSGTSVELIPRAGQRAQVVAKVDQVRITVVED